MHANLSLSHIQAAAQRIAEHAIKTPLLENEVLNQRTRARVLLKPECLQKTGSFKFRGAFNKVAQLSAEQLVEIEQKYDETAATRPVTGIFENGLRAVAVIFALYHYLTAGFALPAEHWHMGWHLTGLFILTYAQALKQLLLQCFEVWP